MFLIGCFGGVCFRFGGTPYKRSIESPSAWKSPWFINSFLPGPRIDTEITIEVSQVLVHKYFRKVYGLCCSFIDICDFLQDIGYFMSPGDKSLDAIGLMKQISEHTAAAYANAQEVLGNETPKTLLKEKRTNHGNLDQENSHVPHNHTGSRSQLAPNVLV